MRNILTLVGLALLIMMSCTDSKSKEESVSDVPPYFISADDVKKIYGYYVSGDYSAYVDCMAQRKGMTTEYRNQMITLMRQHAKDQKKDDGEIRQIEVARIVPCNKGDGAEAYLNVSYENGETEEILLQLVFDGEKWLLR